MFKVQPATVKITASCKGRRFLYLNGNAMPKKMSMQNGEYFLGWGKASPADRWDVNPTCQRNTCRE